MLRSCSTIFCVWMALGCSLATAETIGVGLDWRGGIFAQEYWHKGAPHYLLANLSKEDVQITVHTFDSKWRLGQPLPKPLAGPWKVPAGGHALVDAKPVVGEGLRRFMIVGKQPLGVLGSPSDPGYDGVDFATATGLNGSGGTVPGVFLTQSKLELTGGSTAKVVLRIPSKSGVLKINLKPDKIDDPLRPAALIVESASSTTLEIKSDDKQITIDTESPKAEAKSHEIVLNVALPKVKSPQLLMLDSWLARSNGGGNGITRGLWVVP